MCDILSRSAPPKFVSFPVRSCVYKSRDGKFAQSHLLTTRCARVRGKVFAVESGNLARRAHISRTQYSPVVMIAIIIVVVVVAEQWRVQDSVVRRVARKGAAKLLPKAEGHYRTSYYYYTTCALVKYPPERRCTWHSGHDNSVARDNNDVL